MKKGGHSQINESMLHCVTEICEKELTITPKQCIHRQEKLTKSTEWMKEISNMTD